MTLDERLIRVVPEERQVAIQRLEFYAFIHFTVNAFTDREWGDGTESPAIFNPEKLDADQWVRAVRRAGMRGLILTCKHHDGFCLWPSKYTAHSVASSPFRGGRGDVVREVSDACRRQGIRFGVYLSPWDRNCPKYGSGREYDDYFVSQLTELLTGYGEIFSVWFDGACGEGPNGKKQVYDWPRYFETVRALQPGACMSVCGPDVRWCGNEAGQTRPSEWSVVSARMRDTEKTAGDSQKADSAAFRLRPLRAQDQDLGSREALRDEPELVWYPAEVNTSIRPGWFWHASENDKVKSLDQLKKIYLNSVGGNATFLLNVPPTDEGLIHENDVKRLAQLGDFIKNAFARNLAPEAEIRASAHVPGCGPEHLTEDAPEPYYMSEGPTAELTLQFPRRERLGWLVLRENIRMSQRIERFTVEIARDDGWKEAYSGTVVGNKRIVPLNGAAADAVRVRITDARVAPTLAFLGVYAADGASLPE